LKAFAEEYGAEYNSFHVEIVSNNKFVPDQRSKDIRRGSTYHWLAALRNRILDKCVELNCDYLLSCDSDIILSTDTLKRLLAHNKPVVSSLVYNGYLKHPDEAYKYPNVLQYDSDAKTYKHVVSYRIRHPEKNPVGYTLKVDFTGACILINKEICRKARYGYYYRGEDEPFCRSARNYTELLCDVSLFNLHIMSRSMLDAIFGGNDDDNREVEGATETLLGG
jgi:hypothetical protein